jgi:ribosomal protein L13E
MAKKAKKKLVRREYTKEDVKTLKAHSKAQTPLEKISKEMKRTGGSLRQKAIKLGIPLGHRRRKVKKAVPAKTTKTAKKSAAKKAKK